MLAFSLSLVMGKAPYSDHHSFTKAKVGYGSNKKVRMFSSFLPILSRIFTFRLIKLLPLIAVCASLTGILEGVMYSFLAFNTFDKTDDPVLGLPFLIFIAYYGSMFIASIGECTACFKHSYYLTSKTKKKGACMNFFIFSAVGALIIIGALADN